MPFQSIDQCGVQLPQFNGRVPTTGQGNQPAICTETDIIDSTRKPFQSFDQGAVQIPKFDCTLPAGRGKQLAVGTEADASDWIEMPLQSVDQCVVWPPRLTTQPLTVWSQPAEAISSPSGLKLTLLLPPVN